jgi:hypothetical protein
MLSGENRKSEKFQTTKVPSQSAGWGYVPTCAGTEYDTCVSCQSRLIISNSGKALLSGRGRSIGKSPQPVACVCVCVCQNCFLADWACSSLFPYLPAHTTNMSTERAITLMSIATGPVKGSVKLCIISTFQYYVLPSLSQWPCTACVTILTPLPHYTIYLHNRRSFSDIFPLFLACQHVYSAHHASDSAHTGFNSDYWVTRL